MNLTGALERPEADKQPSIYAPSIRYFSVAQVITFGAALVLTMVFGLTAF